MKNFLKSLKPARKMQQGFTLIELLIVFTVIGIISTVSISSFVSYSRGAVIQQATNDVVALLRDAKSRTQSQVKPSSCTGSLTGYKVDICGLASSSCSTTGNYQLSVVCSNGTTILTTRTLPSSVTFSANGTTSTSFLFKVLSNGVTGDGSVTLSSTDVTKIITVGQNGIINAN